MARVVIEIPDGKFCADKNHLDCLYASHENELHWCGLYRTYLGELESYQVQTSNGTEKMRLREKCSSCFINMQEDSGRGIVPLSEVVDGHWIDEIYGNGSRKAY